MIAGFSCLMAKEPRVVSSRHIRCNSPPGTLRSSPVGSPRRHMVQRRAICAAFIILHRSTKQAMLSVHADMASSILSHLPATDRREYGSNDPCDEQRCSLCLIYRPAVAIKYFPDRKKGSFIEKAATPHDTDHVYTALAGPVTADLPTNLHGSYTCTYAHTYI